MVSCSKTFFNSPKLILSIKAKQGKIYPKKCLSIVEVTELDFLDIKEIHTHTHTHTHTHIYIIRNIPFLRLNFTKHVLTINGLLEHSSYFYLFLTREMVFTLYNLSL